MPLLSGLRGNLAADEHGGFMSNQASVPHNKVVSTLNGRLVSTLAWLVPGAAPGNKRSTGLATRKAPGDEPLQSFRRLNSTLSCRHIGT